MKFLKIIIFLFQFKNLILQLKVKFEIYFYFFRQKSIIFGPKKLLRPKAEHPPTACLTYFFPPAHSITPSETRDRTARDGLPTGVVIWSFQLCEHKCEGYSARSYSRVKRTLSNTTKKRVCLSSSTFASSFSYPSSYLPYSSPYFQHNFRSNCLKCGCGI